MRTLRQDQLELLIEVSNDIAMGLRRIMVQAPTGAGKTICAASLVRSYREQGKRIIFVVPAINLISQTIEKFNSEDIWDIGVMQANHIDTNWDMPVQICSIQTLMRRKCPPADIVIIDEAHTWFKHYEKWLLDPEWAEVPFIGLSATPWTKGLGAWYQKLIIAGTIEEYIDEGILSKFKVFAPAHPDLKGVRTLAGDYHEGDLEKAINQKHLVADIVETWLKRANGLPTLCFCVNRAHAKEVMEQFKAKGVFAGYQDAYTKPQERRELEEAFREGRIKVACSVGTLIVGIDWDVRCLIWARPTKSEILYVQGTGRGLRTADGKDHLIILDHSDNALRLGFVTDIAHEKLNTGTKHVNANATGIRLPKECPQCSFLKPPKMLACPNCGFATKPVVDVIVKEGELIEFTKKDKQPGLFDKEEAYAGLLWYAQYKGFKNGWAWHQFNEMFKEFPNGINVMPREPTMKLMKWIKSRQIRWAHSKSRIPLRP